MSPHPPHFPTLSRYGAHPEVPLLWRPVQRRQIRWHMDIYRQRLGLALNDEDDLDEDDLDEDDLDEDEGEDEGANPAPINVDLDPGDAGPAPNELEPTLGDADVDLGGVDMEDAMGMEEVGSDTQGSDVDMNLDDDDDGSPAPPPELPPAPALRRNPPVMIEEWPDPDASDVGSNLDNESADDGERDPDYIERDEPLRFDPDDEPEMDHEELWAFLEGHLGDLAYDEWIDMYDRNISDKDRTVLQFLATRLRTHFSRQTYDDLRHGACEPLDLPSEFVAWRRLRILSGLETHAYNCCVNSCCCFLGKYKDLDSCPFCRERRYNAAGKARRLFHYSPLVPQLHGLFQSAASVQNMSYRVDAKAAHEPGRIFDVFDGEHYCTLRNTKLREDDDYRFFDNLEDIALRLATDGFSLFKRRHRGISTAWPIILINYNLPPKVRTRLGNIIWVGVVPGPKQCKDLNSFLIPLLEELLDLVEGIESSKVAVDDAGDEGSYFVLRAFIIILFGDIPAVSKLLAMRGHNAIMPCRACYVRGVLCRLVKNSIYYVPLTNPGEPEPFSPDNLVMRTHLSFLLHFTELDDALTDAERTRVSRDCGIHSRSIFASLKSVDLASSAPYDLMHLFFENLVPNMIKHWTGKFKGLGQGTGNYKLNDNDWSKISRLTAKAARTIPSAFVGTLPNIAEDGNLYKAEAYSFWFQYVAPIVLRDRLPAEYYKHFLLMREIFILCLDFEITSEHVDGLEEMVNEWVGDYERLYYQYQQTRLPTCPLTIHALLHLPYYIRRTGPLWASWAFVMERFCGHLLVPAIKNRIQPYRHLDNYVQRCAQMQIVSRVCDMPSLARPRVNYRYQAGERLSSHEKMYDEFPNVVLGKPVNKNVRVTQQLTNQLTKYFGVVYGGELTAQQLRDRIDMDTLVRYGCFRLASDGDKIRTAGLIARDSTARDNSFVRYDLLPDANADYRNLPDVPVRVTHYGQVLDIYYVEFIEDLQNNARRPYLLVRVKECNTRGLDAALAENPFVVYTRLSTPDIIHIETVNAVIGRIQTGHASWAIIDRSRNGARTHFVDDEGNDLD